MEKRHHGSVITAVVHELLKAQSFDDYGDLVDAVKWRCARLRLPYDAGRVTDAIHTVARTRPLFAARIAPVSVMRPARPPIEAPPISQSDAVAILRRLGVAV